MRELFFLAAFMLVYMIGICQEEAYEKTGLLLDKCAFEPATEVMVLRDEAEMSVNNDYSLRLDRHITYKFFKEKKIDRQLAGSIFGPSPFFEKYYRLSVRTIELDPGTKSLIPRDYGSRITSTHIDQMGIKVKEGGLLEVSYSINFPYDQKVAAWCFQSLYPTELSSLKLSIPSVVQIKATLVGGYTPEVEHSAETTKLIRLNNQSQTLPVKESYYQFNQLPSAMTEPFADHSCGQLERLHIHIDSVIKGNEVKKDFIEKQKEDIAENLSTRVDFLLRIGTPIEIRGELDRRIRSVTGREERMARIYDLVRRHLTWDRIDSLVAGRNLNKVWNDKRGNSTEINLILVKLLQTYGYDAAPLIVSTRTNGPIDTEEVSIGDFNRTVAHVNLDGKSIVLDASGRFYDYPAISASILNTHGLLISMGHARWINISDTSSLYKNTVTLLGHLSGDTSFLTNVYVNSYGYAKPEHVDIMETDSLKGLRRYFERGNKGLQLKHFIAANEYVDTLPLAQEFDVRVPLMKNDNLAGLVTTWFSIPDTLFSIVEDRKCDANFGYRQEYDLVSEFTFPENYEIYLLPNYIHLTSVDGSVVFDREYHPGSSDFSLKQSLVINKSYFTKTEALELAKFLKKINALNNQQVVLKKNFAR